MVGGLGLIAAKAELVTNSEPTPTRADFLSRLVDHEGAPGTARVEGTYREQLAVHYVDPESGLDVVSTREGFWAAWRLGPAQIENVILRESLS